VGAQHERPRPFAQVDRVGVACALRPREAVTGDRDAAVLEVAGQGRLACRRVAAAEQTGEGER